MIFKKILINIDDRREKLEDFIADRILKNIDENTKIDALERQAIITALTATNAYLMTYGIPVLPDKIRDKIADVTVDSLSKANKLIQKQLKKKSKSYQERHKDND